MTMANPDGLAQRLRLARLYDIYSGLLTSKQQDCLRLYAYEDLSLSEIGSELGVSRQAVYDLLRRVEQTLERHEARLGLLERQQALTQELRQVARLLQEGRQEEALDRLEDCIKTRWDGE